MLRTCSESLARRAIQVFPTWYNVSSSAYPDPTTRSRPGTALASCSLASGPASERTTTTFAPSRRSSSRAVSTLPEGSSERRSSIWLGRSEEARSESSTPITPTLNPAKSQIEKSFFPYGESSRSSRRLEVRTGIFKPPRSVSRRSRVQVKSSVPRIIASGFTRFSTRTSAAPRVRKERSEPKNASPASRASKGCFEESASRRSESTQANRWGEGFPSRSLQTRSRTPLSAGPATDARSAQAKIEIIGNSSSMGGSESPCPN